MAQYHFMERRGIVIGGTYVHKPSGGTYRVDNLIHDATGYETSGKVKIHGTVLYSQLHEGEFPKGTQWTRAIEDFLRAFKQAKPRKGL